LEQNRHKIIGQWLLLGVGMLIVQIALGGITRLTGSGLSITEWNLVLGALPPLNQEAWQQAFEQYQQIGQFKYVNADFTLADFKFIYFWEWFHRNWGRLLGLVFALPFIYFLIKGMVPRSFIPKLIILFLLGMSQGLIGWIMVASGINDTNLYVDHFKLALHFISALFLISLTFWYALQYIYPNGFVLNISKQQQQLLLFIFILLGIQLTYGAFMAGLKAAQVAPSWPSINGDYVPTSIWTKNIFSHAISVHFMHRTLAYILFIVILFWSWQAKKTMGLKSALAPGVLVFVQLLLGIGSVLYSPQAVKNGWGIFEWNAQLHQLVAMLLLLSLVYHLFQMKTKSKI
jgi:heme a synthase